MSRIWDWMFQEALAKDLVAEDIEKLKDGRLVASYVSKEDAEWLQAHRIELNARK